MTLIDLIKHLRESILDDTGGTGVDWTGVTEDDLENYQLRWSNEELSRFINEAQKKAARNALLIRKSENDLAIDVIADQSEYTYNPKILRIKSAYLGSTGRILTPTEYEDFDGLMNWRTKTGVPVKYILDENTRSIRLYPVPEDDDTIYLVYNRLPLVDLTWDDPEAEPEIAEEWQIDMLDYAAHMAYLKSDANTSDAANAAFFLQKFISNFSTTSAYAEARRRRSSNRSVRYRDLF